MRLIVRILTRLVPALMAIITLWGIFFYYALMDEVNDETDDTLEDYSEIIITRFLAGQEMPSQADGTNNSYYLTQVPEKYAEEHEKIRYSDEMIYIPEKKETEPARILKTIFQNENEEYYELTVSIPNIEKEDLREAILYWIIFLYFTLLITILLINLWVFYRSMRPLYALLKWLDHYTISNNTPTLENNTTITEFKNLNEAVLRQAERNKNLFEQQKQFISNASHELQIPLAICRNRLEMLADNETLTEEQLTEIFKTQSTLDYIIKLNKSLLFLSKIDNGQFQEIKEISFNELIHKFLPDYEEAYGYLNITTHVEEKGTFTVGMDEALSGALVSNLLKNAFVHNRKDKGELHIEITSGSIIVLNTGDEGMLDETHLFERFRQGKTKKEGSTGLGLSIMAAICKTYRLQIRYFYNGKHGFEIKKS